MKNYSKLLLSAFAILPLVLSSFVARNASSESYKTSPYYFYHPIPQAKGTSKITAVTLCITMGTCTDTSFKDRKALETVESRVVQLNNIFYYSKSRIENIIDQYK